MIRDPVVHDTLIIGVGNPFRGDDGIGPRVVQNLVMRELPDGVEVMDGGIRGLDLVTLFEGRQRVIIVDAADLGRPPGEFERFTMDHAQVQSAGRQLSIHTAGLGDALLLAEALGMLPQQLVIFGVQPARLDWNEGFSLEVEQAIPKVVSGILAELNGGTPFA